MLECMMAMAALLSVLGGVTALCPIGIFVGPIAVAFLQAALTMLAVEIDSLETRPDSPGEARPAAGEAAGSARAGEAELQNRGSGG